jgi:hypothetical protein
MKKGYIQAPIQFGSPPKDSYIYHKIMKLVDILSEIKVNAPRPFVYDAYYYDEDHDDSTEGELYFNGELLDGDAVYSYGISDGDKIYYIAFYLDTPTYARLFDKLSPYIHDKIIGNSTKRTLAQITDYPDDYEHMLIIRDLNKVNLKNLPPFINEIKVVPPGLINTLKNYKSQIESSNDLKLKITLALQCAKLVLPIFEKLVPDDKIPREAIESIQAYLLNPTTANEISLQNINLKSPGYPIAAKLVHNTIDMVLGAIISRNKDKLQFTLSSATYAIMAAEKDKASHLDEIKVLSPTPKFTNNEQLSLYLKEHPKFRGILVDKIVKDIGSKPYPHLTEQQWLDIVQDWKTWTDGLQYKQYIDEITVYSELDVNLYLSLDPMEFQDGAIVFGTNTFNYGYTIV